MAKHNATNISNETVEEALAIAKKTQKSGQSKEQTRLIAQGIQKGIAEYKKSVKAKLIKLKRNCKNKNRQQTRHNPQRLMYRKKRSQPNSRGFYW